MIKPITFLWKQLNGPQITAICKAIYNWIKESLDTTLDYFDNLSIATANDDHLTTIGTLQSVIRPLISEEVAKSFWFTDGKTTSTGHGFSSESGSVAVGGKFTDYYSDIDLTNSHYLPESYYRPLLKCIYESEGELGSLMFLDNLCKLFYNTYRPGDDLDYKIEFVSTITEDRSYGDIRLYIGNQNHWLDTSIYVYATLNAVAKSGYNPTPTIVVELADVN